MERICIVKSDFLPSASSISFTRNGVSPYSPAYMSNLLSNVSVKQLKQAIKLREKMEVLQSKLDQLLGSSEGLPAAKGKPGRKPKRKMSAAAKAKISAAAKLRWKKAKASGNSRL